MLPTHRCPGAALLFALSLLGCSSSEAARSPGSAGAVATAGGGGASAGSAAQDAGGSTAQAGGSGSPGSAGGGAGGFLGGGGSGASAGSPALPEPFVCPYEIEPSGYCFADVTAGAAGYPAPAEAVGPIDGAPAGQLVEGKFASVAYGQEFPYAVYIPAQYDGAKPAALMMVQDLVHYLSRTEATFETPQVLDNLIHAGDIPVTIAVFHEPAACSSPAGQPGSYCRDLVYNRASPAYAEFVVSELIPHVVATHGLSITSDPSGWLAVGFSAGGAAALGLAYHRPDKFQRVITHNGSFVPAAKRIGDLTGSEAYISGLASSEVRPLRITLSTGPKDNNNEFGSWLLANQELARVLDEKGYHYRFSIGDGGHYPPLQAAAMFPDDLRFIWADYAP